MSTCDTFDDVFDCDAPASSSSATADPDAVIADAITGPKSTTVDGVSMSQFSPAELIVAAKYLAAQKAAKKPHRGLRFTKLVPGGPS